uniref:Uncharacterized protein n=1 Tax=Chenopodium quinoa TaxID=63459 RepID=A0A803N0E0_CHEQI
MCQETARYMTWHADGCENDHLLHHPVDGQAWKEFNSIYPKFVDDPRNPLIKDLKDLWEFGLETCDASTNQRFDMHVALMTTMSDFPGYTMLSGWSTKGYLACLECHYETDSEWLPCSELNMMPELQPIELEDSSEEFPRSRFWMSLEQKQKDDDELITVNMNKTVSKEEPFILATQAHQNSIPENEDDDSTSEYDGENEVETDNIMEADNLILEKEKNVSKQVKKLSLRPKTMADVVEVNSRKKHAVDEFQNIHLIEVVRVQDQCIQKKQHVILERREQNERSVLLEKYMVPEAGREWVMQAINGSLKAHKSFTKKNYFYAYPVDALRWFHKRDTISEPQFREILQYWHSKEAEQQQDPDPDKQEPSQARVYKESRKRTAKMDALESSQHEDGSNSKDPYSEVIPDPKHKSRVCLQGKVQQLAPSVTTAILTQLRDANPRINLANPDFAIPPASKDESSAPHLLVDQNGQSSKSGATINQVRHNSVFLRKTIGEDTLNRILLLVKFVLSK